MATRNNVHEAVKRGNYAYVCHLLQKQIVHVDYRDPMKQTLLMTCLMNTYKSRHAQLSMLKHLLFYQPDVNLKDCDLRTALVHACIARNSSALRLLLNETMQDQDFACQDKYGMTPLMYAVKSSDIELAKLILDPVNRFGLPLYAENKTGETAFDLAISGKNSSIVRELYFAGCRPKTTSQEKYINEILNENKHTREYQLQKQIKIRKKKLKNNTTLKRSRKSQSAIYHNEIKPRNSKHDLHDILNIYTIQLCPAYKESARLPPVEVGSDRDSDNDSCDSIQSFRSAFSGYRAKRESPKLESLLYNLHLHETARGSPTLTRRKAAITLATSTTTRTRKISAPVMPSQSLLRIPSRRAINLNNILEHKPERSINAGS